MSRQGWVEYRARVDLLNENTKKKELLKLQNKIAESKEISDLLASINQWPSPALKSHKDAKHPIHALTFLADIQIPSLKPHLEKVIEHIVTNKSDEGPFQILVNIPKRFGGTGADQLSWMLCDAPLLDYFLLRLGNEHHSLYKKALDYKNKLIKENGWPCSASVKLGKFRGPGRKSDPCPYATLLMLKAISQIPRQRESAQAKLGAETLLKLWKEKQNSRPFLFAMGTDFQKLKAPLIWYDILHAFDVLSNFSFLKGDKRLRQIAAVIKKKADKEGKYKPESIWMHWKNGNLVIRKNLQGG